MAGAAWFATTAAAQTAGPRAAEVRTWARQLERENRRLRDLVAEAERRAVQGPQAGDGRAAEGREESEARRKRLALLLTEGFLTAPPQAKEQAGLAPAVVACARALLQARHGNPGAVTQAEPPAERPQAAKDAARSDPSASLADSMYENGSADVGFVAAIWIQSLQALGQQNPTIGLEAENKYLHTALAAAEKKVQETEARVFEEQMMLNHFVSETFDLELHQAMLEIRELDKEELTLRSELGHVERHAGAMRALGRALHQLAPVGLLRDVLRRWRQLLPPASW